ncbi:hypothetical protein AB1Y20_010184 [Prymnesium parvum]|uniref:phosphoserine transaminase n=1 Tax=Prymnesium parvum TaxID=97485 RepID=A0AB34K3R0_PRYPA
MNVVHNMSPGPGALPAAVMYKAQQELVSWPGAPGQSVMSVSHREPNGPYQKLAAKVMQQVRDVLDVPSDYHVLFMHGGAHAQYAAVPLNLAGATAMQPNAARPRCTSIDTGFWARRAAAEHAKYCEVSWGGSSRLDEPIDATGAPKERDWRAATCAKFTTLPPSEGWVYREDDSFVHVCANETIHGVEFLSDPSLPSGAPPLVGDFTSSLLSRPVDVSKYGVLYASGGKNLGPAGLTLVLVRDELLGAQEHPLCPSFLSYRELAGSKPQPNLYLTPPTFCVYMTGLMLEWVTLHGGLEAAEIRAKARSELLYEVIDSSNGFYVNHVEEAARSRISIPFRIDGSSSRSPLDSEKLERAFVAESEAAGFRSLAGHPLAGGMRASLYHGVPDASVAALANFMRRFCNKYQ